MLSPTGQHPTYWRASGYWALAFLSTTFLLCIELGVPELSFSLSLLPFEAVIFHMFYVVSRNFARHLLAAAGPAELRMTVLIMGTEATLLAATMFVCVCSGLKLDEIIDISWVVVCIPLIIFAVQFTVASCCVLGSLAHDAGGAASSLITAAFLSVVCAVLPAISLLMFAVNVSGENRWSYGTAAVPVVITALCNCAGWYFSCSVYWADANSESLPPDLLPEPAWNVYHAVSQTCYIIGFFGPILTFLVAGSMRMDSRANFPATLLYVPPMLLTGGLAVCLFVRPAMSKMERRLKFGRRLSPELLEAIRELQRRSFVEPGAAAPLGLTEAQIDMLPVTTFDAAVKGVHETCVICQYSFNDGDDVFELTCSHQYHEECAREWLSRHRVCPLCKKEVTVEGGGGGSGGQASHGHGPSAAHAPTPTPPVPPPTAGSSATPMSTFAAAAAQGSAPPTMYPPPEGRTVTATTTTAELSPRRAAPTLIVSTSDASSSEDSYLSSS